MNANERPASAVTARNQFVEMNGRRLAYRFISLRGTYRDVRCVQRVDEGPLTARPPWRTEMKVTTTATPTDFSPDAIGETAGQRMRKGVIEIPPSARS